MLYAILERGREVRGVLCRFLGREVELAQCTSQFGISVYIRNTDILNWDVKTDRTYIHSTTQAGLPLVGASHSSSLIGQCLLRADSMQWAKFIERSHNHTEVWSVKPRNIKSEDASSNCVLGEEL